MTGNVNTAGNISWTFSLFCIFIFFFAVRLAG